jgi:hypothetical protein
MTLSFSKTDLLLTAIPLLLIIPVLAHGQQEQQGQLQQGAPIQPLDLTNGVFNLYNESSGSTSTMAFTPETPGSNHGTYIRDLNGNQLQGIWRSSVESIQVLHICATSDNQGKWLNSCINLGLRTNPDDPTVASFMDTHGNHLEISKSSEEGDR